MIGKIELQHTNPNFWVPETATEAVNFGDQYGTYLVKPRWFDEYEYSYSGIDKTLGQPRPVPTLNKQSAFEQGLQRFTDTIKQCK